MTCRASALRGCFTMATSLPLLFGVFALNHCSGADPSVLPEVGSTSAALTLQTTSPAAVITLQNANGNCLDVVGGNSSPGAKVQAYTCNGTASQNVALNANGTITNNWNLCLDVMNGDTNAGNLQFTTCNGTGSQVWQQDGLEIVGPAKKCLNVSTTSVPNGGLALNLATCNGSAAQSWQVIDAPTTLHGVGTKCLDIINGSTSPGARLQIYECNGGTNSQQFTFTAAGEIRNTAGECLDVMNGNVAAGQVQMTTCNGTRSQKWSRQGRIIVSNLQNGLVRMCLSTMASASANASFLESSKDHTAVGVAICNGTEAQQWFPEGLYFQNSLATLLVVTSDAFAPAFTSNAVGPNGQTFVSWKASIGVPTKVLTVSQARAAFPAVDDALSIKYAIEDAYRNTGTRYVLLGGDASQVPVRYKSVLDGANCGNNGLPAGSTRSYQFSELYYENLYHGHAPGNGSEFHSGGFDNWDANGNGLYNEADWTNPLPNPDNVDGFPDIAVGRIPAFTESGLQGALAKIVAYEKENPAYGGTFAPSSSYGWAADTCYPTSDTDILSIANSVNVGTTGGAAFVVYAENTCATYASPVVGDNWSAFQAALQASRFEWVTYIGHGYPGGLDGYDASKVALLTNTYKPVVMAGGCQTGMFAPVPQCMALTYQPTIYDSTDDSTGNIGAAFLQNPNGGGVAFMGENIVMPDDLPTSFITSVHAQHTNGFQRIGDMWRMAQQAYFAAHTPAAASDGYFGLARIYPGIESLLADPSMRTP